MTEEETRALKDSIEQGTTIKNTSLWTLSILYVVFYIAACFHLYLRGRRKHSLYIALAGIWCLLSTELFFFGQLSKTRCYHVSVMYATVIAFVVWLVYFSLA